MCVPDEQNFGVALRSEGRSDALEVGPHRPVIVDLAVVDEGEATLRIDHRLVGHRARIEDREPAMNQCQARFGEAAAGIGSPMKQISVDRVEQRVIEASPRLDQRGEPAHVR